MSTYRISSGSTPPGATNWQPYGTNGVYVDVDTSAGRFSSTPVYITSIDGNSHHWETTGASSVYQATSRTFRVYVRFSDGRPVTPADANARQWHINWIGMEA